MIRYSIAILFYFIAVPTIQSQFEWIADDFRGSTITDIIEKNGKYFAAVSNGVIIEEIPEINFQLLIYEIEFNQGGEPGIHLSEIKTIPFPENFATYSVAYIKETNTWIAVQSAFISPGRQILRTLLLDEDFNLIASREIDTLGYPLKCFLDSHNGKTFMLGSLLGPPQDELFFQIYAHQNSDTLPPIVLKQSLPRPMFWVTSMDVDPNTGDMLVFYYNGIAVLDSNLFQKKRLSYLDIKTSDHGSILAVDSNYYTHGTANHAFEVGRWNVLHKYDTSFHILFADTFGVHVTDNYPFIYQSIVHRSDEFVVGGHLDGPFNGLDFYTRNKKFYIAKYNEDMNELWYKEYGGDKAYCLAGVYLLDDGGVLAYGFITDSTDNHRYGYLMHLDANGEILSTSTIPSQPETSIRIINPGNQTLRILNPDAIDARIVLYDLQGHELLSEAIDATETEFPADDFPAGVYPYTLKSDGRVIGVGKWVKGQ